MITIEINDTDVTSALARAVTALTDTTPLMEGIAEYLRTSTVKRFKEGKAPDGSSWSPNSPVTLARKKNTRPLFGPNDRLNKEFGISSGADYAEISSVLPYAAVQQFGARKGSLGAYWWTTESGKVLEGSSPWGDIPARPYLGISEEDRTNILDIISEYIEGVLHP